MKERVVVALAMLIALGMNPVVAAKKSNASERIVSMLKALVRDGEAPAEQEDSQNDPVTEQGIQEPMPEADEQCPECVDAEAMMNESIAKAGIIGGMSDEVGSYAQELVDSLNQLMMMGQQLSAEKEELVQMLAEREAHIAFLEGQINEILNLLAPEAPANEQEVV